MIRWIACLAPWWLCVMAAGGWCADTATADVAGVVRGDSPSDDNESEGDESGDLAEETPWDYSPYRVLVWLVSDNPRLTAASIDKPLRAFLDRDFSAIWRLTIADAPSSIAALAQRDFESLSYDMITAADPVLAIKRDHPEAVRIRVAANVGEFVRQVYGTKSRIDEVLRRGDERGDETLKGVAGRLQTIDSDSSELIKLWAKPETEGVLVTRGMAMSLTDPEAKLIMPPVSRLVGETVESYDKVFIVSVRQQVVPTQIDVVEMDTLMRHFGPVGRVESAGPGLADRIGQGLIDTFSPVVRIDDAGQKSAVGLLRASGLILDDASPANVVVGDVLQPMTRKNDRNGKPIIIGPMDWAYLLATEVEGRDIHMDFYAGRAGGLQGRKNKRTFRMGLKVRPAGESTLLRLHAQGDPREPLIGYEIYEKELKSTDMTFVGRTDWNGRLRIERTEDPLRLLYVKNGGAVLARLPVVPGLTEKEVADLRGDDLRLQAEAYIRGVQNAIIDLVAVRELFKARIRLRLEQGEMEKAEELMQALREQPSNEKLANEMGKRQTAFLKELGTRNANQRRKVDEMFTTTRDLLAKHINPRLIRELEADLIAAKRNGGKLPPADDPQADDETEGGAAADPSAAAGG